MRFETCTEPSRSEMVPCGCSCDFVEVALDQGDALDAGPCPWLCEHLKNLAGLALVGAGDDDDLVAAFDVEFLHGQRTSGASEMIFMKFFARSSRATGPKMWVPFGLLVASMMTIALLSNRR